MMPDTIKTTENSETGHCEEQRGEAIKKSVQTKLDCRARSRSLAMMRDRQCGNAMIYVLIALALFGFLTMTLSRSNDQADGQDIDDEQATLYALELMEYVASVQHAADMMLISGSNLDDLDFVIPSDAAFNTTPPPNYHKLFHAQGGGVNYQNTFSEAIQNDAASAWHVNTNIDIEWTPEDSLTNLPIDDVILTAYFVTRQICEIINEKITGSTTIPVTASPHIDYFPNTGNTNIDTTECAGCEGHASLCVENDTNDNYSFYSIIAAQ